MNDCVLSYHTNALMGGVSNFSAQLAKRLGVPHLECFGASKYSQPLISIKLAEFQSDYEFAQFSDHAKNAWLAYDVFWHDTGARCFTRGARRVIAANAEIADYIRKNHGREDVITAHCPGLISQRGQFPEAAITLFGFGFGHKLRVDLYKKLKEMLDATSQTYTVYLSAGLHTGARVVDDPFLALEQLFGDRLIFLGILSDRAVAHYLATSTYVVCFFEKGVRENNTTVNAALDAGALVITNCDAWTPQPLRWAVRSIHDPHALWRGPHDPVMSPYHWDGLLKKLR